MKVLDVFITSVIFVGFLLYMALVVWMLQAWFLNMGEVVN